MDANSPGGPFTNDLIGAALANRYDPTIFIDDDANQTPYLLAGVYDYYIRQLNNDMKSFAAPSETFLYHSSDDKNYLHKRKGVYYLSWASWYASSTNLYGPYTLKGFIGSSDDHGNFFSWHNQDFQSFTIYESGIHFRAIGLTYVNYLNNNEIAPVDQTIVKYGVGKYDASWDKMQAEWYMNTSAGILKRETPHGGFEIQNALSNGWLYFPHVENMASNSTITFYYSNGATNENQVQIRQNSAAGPILGGCSLPPTGGWSNYACASCSLTNSAGVNDLYLTFVNSNGPHLDWFRLGSPPSTSLSQQYLIQNERWGINELATNTHSGGYFESLTEDTNAFGGKLLTKLCYDGAYVQFNSIYGGAAGGPAQLTFDYCSQSTSNVYNLYVNGNYVRQLSFPYTGGWTMAKSNTFHTTVVLQPSWNNQVKLEKYLTVGGINLADVVVDASQPPPPPYPPYFLPIASVTASSWQTGFGPTNAVDGNYANFWVSYGTLAGQGPDPSHPEWIQVTFPRPVALSEFQVYPRSDNGGYGPKDIQLLLNGVSVYQGTMAPTFPLDVHLPSPVNATNAQLLITSCYDRGSTVNTRNVQVDEITFYERALPGTYGDWALHQFSDAQLADSAFGGATADPDHDGVPNLAEFATGGNPLVADASASSLELTPSAPGTFTFTFRERKDLGDVQRLFQTSTNLQDWAAVAPTTLSVVSNLPDVYVRGAVFPMQPGAGFFRVRFVLQPSP